MINLLIADDHKMIIDGLKSMLGAEEGMRVVGEAYNGKEVLERLKQHKVDLILMDINMPELDGIGATRKLKAQFPKVKVLVLTMYNKPEFVRNLMEAGADGYILKNTGRDELLEAIRQLHAGQPYWGREVTQTVMESMRRGGANDTLVLTKREKEILKLIVEEYTTPEIADKLFISNYTVETHRKNLLSKLGAKNTAGLVRYAMENGYMMG